MSVITASQLRAWPMRARIPQLCRDGVKYVSEQCALSSAKLKSNRARIEPDSWDKLSIAGISPDKRPVNGHGTAHQDRQRRVHHRCRVPNDVTCVECGRM
jgi:hypothetical protein